MSKSARSLPWRLWIFCSLAAVPLVIGLASEAGSTDLTPAEWASLTFGLAPLIGVQLTLGSPNAAQSVRNWLGQVHYPLFQTAGGIIGLYMLSGLLAGEFDPYAAAIFAIGTLASLGTLRQIERGKPGLTWADIAVWILIWIPFDLRWNYEIWFGIDSFAYNWWAVAITVLAVIGWYGFREMPDFGYKLIPNGNDLLIALIATLIFVSFFPIGLAMDLLQFPPTTQFSSVAFLTHFIFLFLTVAIPEELFFRGILLHGLDQMYTRPWLNLLLSSLAFGLMHWNNVDDLTAKIVFCVLGTLSGMFNGWAYRRSGNKLIAPVLFHTLTVLIWRFLFQ